jgi:hypothetical protein
MWTCCKKLPWKPKDYKYVCSNSLVIQLMFDRMSPCFNGSSNSPHT